MARPLRLLVPGGTYHAMARGNAREDIYRGRSDRLLFLRLLGEKGVNALERLMGLILVMMATQMFLDGIRAWMKG